jgi:hypothetical protein
MLYHTRHELTYGYDSNTLHVADQTGQGEEDA